MTKMLAVVGIIAIAAFGLAANDEKVVTRFDGGIGVQPVLMNTATFMPFLHVVRGIGPGALPWAIHSLKARLEADGELEVRGRGLVLAAGIAPTGAFVPIGTRGDLTAVRALLFCGASNTPHVSPTGALDVDGDFKIDGVLTPAVGLTCPNPTLLIVVGAGTAQSPFRWIAAGIPDNDDKN